MKKLCIILSILLSLPLSQSVFAENGLITKKSAHSAKETLNRLEAALKKKAFGFLHESTIRKMLKTYS